MIIQLVQGYTPVSAASLGDSAGDTPVITGSIPCTKRIIALRAAAGGSMRPRAREKSDISNLITDESKFRI